MNWKEFDRMMMDVEHLHSKNKLTQKFINVLLKNRCWKKANPYCSWDSFSYKLKDEQINEIHNAYNELKEERRQAYA
jgi:hypothetical protein